MESLRIERKHGCILTFGSVPVPTMMELIEEAGEDSLMDMDLARKIGASLVLGDEDSLKTLRQDPEIRQTIISKVAGVSVNFEVPASAIHWLEDGERGLSSETIFYHLTQMPIIEKDDLSYPRDADDLRRCRLLLETVPEFNARFGEMASLSSHWKALVDNWETLCQTMDDEAPRWRQREGRCEKTYKLMKKLFNKE